ncbi:myosin heavy chain, clone 203-like [Mytilus edulis]|uniref:myosin heavy chain, clone 203-like n=1 Tax=Mytilus edulis TaxID=6550 RepID=UPI0039F106E1
MPFYYFWNKEKSEENTETIDELNEEVVKNQNSVEDLISQLTDASKHQNRIINTFQNANKRLRTENEEQRKKYTELQQHIDAMKTKEASKIIKEQKVQTDLQSQLSATELKLDEAERTIQRMTMEKEDKERKINQLETNLSELRKLESRIDELNRETRLLKRRIDTVCKEKDSLQRNADSVEQERDELKLRIDSLIAQKCSAVNIQMYAAVNKELCDKMMAELEGMLITQFGMKNTPINVEKHKEPPPDSKVPLIVICINASRLGTDVNQAIHKIDRARTIAVVVLHHKEYHALPKQPSERLLIGSDYKHIGAIVDIAYITTKGIYPCDMNEKSLDRLVNFINSNS